ncbi:hypothetical protein RvY_11596 [Ramazzottius varieornatus]|uniref:Chromo domain-containing protein n=1 Tax=Ramazzottius varieornatus TaxID=947166 RepID=A0A1D1VQG5_RAMVA|nr:hypothetical protein RvY_11596 [Ramazzottius varieornatus]
MGKGRPLSGTDRYKKLLTFIQRMQSRRISLDIPPVPVQYLPYEVKEIVDDKVINSVSHYKIRWKRYSAASHSWLPAQQVDCPDLLSAYNERRERDSQLDGRWLENLTVIDIIKDVKFPVDVFIDVSSPFAAEEPEPALALSQGPTGARDRRHVAVVAAQKEISRTAALPYIVQLDELGYVVAKDLQVKAAQQLGSDTPLSMFGMRLGRGLKMASLMPGSLSKRFQSVHAMIGSQKATRAFD